MNPEDIVEIIRQLAELANPSVSHIYGVYVRQAVIGGILRIVLPILPLGIVSVNAWKWAREYQKEHKEGTCEPPRYRNSCDCASNATLCFVVAGFCVVFYLIFLGTGLGLLLNPEYQAIQNLLGSIR